MDKVSRRGLGRLVAGLAATHALPLRAQAPTRSSYSGPLTGIVAGLDDRQFDPVDYTRDLFAAAPRQLRFLAAQDLPEEIEVGIVERLRQICRRVSREKYTVLLEI